MPTFRAVFDCILGVPRLRLCGDMTFGEDMSGLLGEVKRLAQAGHRRLVVDLSDVTLADSTGIGALISMKRAVGDTTGTVCLVRPSSRVQASLEVMRVTAMFEIVPDSADEPSGPTGGSNRT